MKQVKKIQTEKFGKKIFYIGQTVKGDHLWLEDFSWNCGWYWGGGYIENYQFNACSIEGIERANDIKSHSHFDQWKGVDDFQNKFKTCVLTEHELYELFSLFNIFYDLKNTAQNYGGETLKDVEMVKRLNSDLETKIFPKIRNLLK